MTTKRYKRFHQTTIIYQRSDKGDVQHVMGYNGALSSFLLNANGPEYVYKL